MNMELAADSKESVGAPGKDIEVTPAMIKAGARELVSFDLDYESWEDAAIRVYKAMYALR